MDTSGTIIGRLYNSLAIQYFETMIEGNIYDMTGGYLSKSDRSYTSVRHPFSINFRDDARICLGSDHPLIIGEEYFSLRLDQYKQSTELVDLVAVIVKIDDL